MKNNKCLKKQKNNVTLLFGAFLACLAVACGILVPMLLLRSSTDKQLSVVKTAPEGYYLASGTVMAKNASEQLSSLDRIKLISGTWESKCVQVKPETGTRSETEIIALAKQQIEYYYRKSVYPYSLSSSYDNWYSWSTELYCYTDTVFNTYTAYLWVIHFTRFDNMLEHTILMTENGTILAAQVNDSKISYSPVKKVYLDENINDVLGDKSIMVDAISDKIDDYTITAYPYIDITDIQEHNIYRITLSSKNSDEEDFYIYQYKTDNTYGIGIISSRF